MILPHTIIHHEFVGWGYHDNPALRAPTKSGSKENGAWNATKVNLGLGTSACLIIITIITIINTPILHESSHMNHPIWYPFNPFFGGRWHFPLAKKTRHFWTGLAACPAQHPTIMGHVPSNEDNCGEKNMSIIIRSIMFNMPICL